LNKKNQNFKKSYNFDNLKTLTTIKMSTYTQILYQVVFGTKQRKKVMKEEDRDRLFRYINGILAEKKCHVYRINGVEDHLHIVTHILPKLALSDVIKDIKLASNDFIKQENLFDNFPGWQIGYGAFTYSIKEKDRLIEYVKSQKEHHRKITFRNEYRTLLKEHEIEFEEKYLL
jgi:putative transposase